MANLWYYQQGDQRMGPVSAEALRALASAGQIRPTDMVIREDMTTWIAANQVRGLIAPAAPVPQAAPMAYENAPVAPLPNYGTPRSSFTPIQKSRRVLLIVVAAIVVACFFTPEYFVSLSPKSARMSSGDSRSILYFGWDLWWGLVTFGVGLAALGVAIADLATGSVPIMRKIFQWFHLATFSAITLITLIGTILGFFAMGLPFKDPSGLGRIGVSLSVLLKQANDVSALCLPITAVLVLAAAVLGTIFSILIITKDKA